MIFRKRTVWTEETASIFRGTVREKHPPRRKILDDWRYFGYNK